MGAAAIFNGQGGGRLADWHDIALDMHLKQGLGAHKISHELGLPFGTVNSFLYRWRKRNGGAPEKNASVDLSERLLSILKKRLGAEFEASDLCDRLGVSKRVLQAVIEDLREQGYIIVHRDDHIKLHKVAPDETNEHVVDWQGNRIIRFGVVSDTHLGSKWQQLTHLNTLYDMFDQEGIDTVYHAGDVTEGVNMRRGHEFEVFAHGADAQVEYVAEKYPRRSGIVTKFITGNHDHSAIKYSGHDIGVAIANKRSDMVYLGRSQARVHLTPNCVLEIHHPLDGACFDDQTEIFTKDGWKPFAELTKEDFVATMTKCEHEFQWQRPTEITVMEYEGDMIHFKSRTIDMMVTPNHGMWVREYPENLNRKENLEYPTKSHRRLSCEWRRETAEYLLENHYRQKWQFTNCSAKWTGQCNGETVIIPRLESKNPGMRKQMQHLGEVSLRDLCELIAWYVTEGSASEKRVTISQSEKVNPENHKRILRLLERLGLRCGVYRRKDIVVNSKELANYLSKTCGAGSKNKRIPEFIKELPKEYLELVFEVLILGDGWERTRGSYGFKSISPRLRADVTEIAVKLGYAVSEKNDTVNITGVQKYPTINNKPKRVPYKGLVFCCRVPNELILVRRNGKATWSHNSYALSYGLQKMIDAMSGGEKPNIYLGGHHHKAMYLFYRNIHAFECGTTQAQTPWMRGKRIPAHMGGWIIEVHVDDEGTVTRCKGEFVPFYVALENDY